MSIDWPHGGRTLRPWLLTLLLLTSTSALVSCEPEPEPLPPNVAEVLGVATSPGRTGLAFDVAAASRTVHLAWRIGKQTVRYARSDDAGRTWEPSRDLGVTGTPRVVAHGDTVLVLSVGHGVVAHTSGDGGRSWTAGGARLLRYSLTASALSRAPGGDLVLAAAAPLPYPAEVVEDGYRHSPSRGVAGRPMTTLAFRSADGGQSWSEPVPLGPFKASGNGGGGVTLSTPQRSLDALYALWGGGELRERPNGVLALPYVYSQSDDGGRSWSRPTNVAGVDTTAYPSLLLGVGAQGEAHFVRRAEDGFVMDLVQGLGRARPLASASVEGDYIDGAGLVPGAPGATYVAWIDRSRAYKPWASRIPLNMMPPPPWPNTDVYLARLVADRGDVRHAWTRLLTPRMWKATGPVRLLRVEDEVLVFWLGSPVEDGVPSSGAQLHVSWTSADQPTLSSNNHLER